jgi:hypothetical protein
MPIFGKRSHEQSVTVESYNGFVDPSLAGIQTINAEAALEAYQLNASLYITDVIMEEAVIEGAAEPEVLLEGVVKDSLTKLKEMFQKFWAKVRAWFEKAKKALQMIFSSGEAFIKKFEEDLNMKNVKGFTYEGFKYTLEAGSKTVKAKVETVEKFLDDTVGFKIDEVQTTTHGQKANIEGNEHSEEYNTAEEKEKLVKQLGSEELSEVLDAVKKSFRDGKEEKEEFTDFSGNSKQELIGIVKNMKKHISEVEKQQRQTDNDFKKVLTAIQNAQSAIQRQKASDEGSAQAKAKMLTFANHKFQLAHYALTIINSLYGVEVDAYKEAAREAEAVLKAYLRFKPAKEGFETPVDDNHETGSILESAMKFI